ncbi:MAG TPA: cytidylate kinase-like family protein [Deltaproteobacteria bacterium]|nr:cytidylate kinase-like family protein [Deltaproteobacteria bacterium]HPJ92786.1 cytidylate kinase-like family protein [Deltaproteobacteria bacterium]HPR50305.1 cytidylate kinase-like family protein [Deltaproteobacteria bacterium]
MGKAITISRDYGCGGVELARTLAKELGYEYIDKSIVVDLAKKMNTSEGEVSSYEDGSSLKLFKVINEFMTAAKVQTILSNDFGYVNNDGYRIGLEGLMKELADQGSVVIVGRGGQCILHNRPDVVHVRLIAPMEYKKEFYAAKSAITKDEAEAIITAKEEERKQYHLKMFDRYHNDPTLYHATINLGLVNQRYAIDMIKVLL